MAANAATNKHDFLVALEQAIKRKKAEETKAAEEQQQPEQLQPAAPVLATAAPALVEEPAPSGLRIVPAG